MFKKISLLCILFAGFSTITAQEKIPFRMTKHNNIIIKTLVNDKDSLDLMFQIAMEDASISPERQRKADHIIFDQNDISKNNTVKIGKLTKKNVLFYNNELTGHEADGKIGTGLFAGKAFKIDYDHNEFLSYDQLPDVKGYEAVPLLLQNGQLFIAGDNVIDGKQYEAYFLLQSGYSGGLLYSNQFSEEKDLEKKLKVMGEKTLRNSSGQSVTTKNGVLPFFKLGTFVLKDVSAGFFTGNLKTQMANYFGADVIRRFIWVIDADRKTAYIKPSQYFSAPYYKIN